MAEPVPIRSECSWKGGATFEHVANSRVPYRTDALLPGEEFHPLNGATPMELLLGAACGCTGADIVSIVRKMNLELKHLSITADGERSPEHPRVFRRILLTYRIETEPVSCAKVFRAVELSAHKYCGVAATLASAGEVRYHAYSGGEEAEGIIQGVAKDSQD